MTMSCIIYTVYTSLQRTSEHAGEQRAQKVGWSAGWETGKIEGKIRVRAGFSSAFGNLEYFPFSV